MAVPTVPGWVPARALVVLLAIALSALTVHRLADTHDSPGEARFGLRDRLLFGVPWGTVLTVFAVACVYWFLQDGWANPRDPVVLPFRSWSYEYPLGMLASAFSHSSWSHVASNLTATVVYAGLAEYAWGHYPTERGAQTFTSLRSNPYARIVAVPLFALLVGLFTAAFSAGPLVGFSGVVFAFFGVALVLRPLLAAFGLLGYEILWRVVRSIANPEFVARPVSRVITPWWADTAIHTHAIGLLLGVLVAAIVCHRRDAWPGARELWFAGLAFAFLHGLWAVFFPLGNGRFVLLRWIGVAAVFVLAAFVVATVARRDRPLLPRVGPSARTTGAAVLLAALAAIALPAIPLNVAPVGADPAPNTALEVRDYTVGYGENVPDGYAAAASIPVVGGYPVINRSGVIVVSEERRVWRLAVPSASLSNRGRAQIDLGGWGWRESVEANWTGWAVSGNGSAYKVFLRRDGGEWRQSFASPERRAEPIIAGRTISIVPEETAFGVAVRRDNETLGIAPPPANGTSQAIGGLTFVRNGSILYAVHNETRVPIAQRRGKTG